MEILEIKQANDALAEMVALFRVELRSYKGIASKPNIRNKNSIIGYFATAYYLLYQ